jgi:hypothetical protein
MMVSTTEHRQPESAEIATNFHLCGGISHRLGRPPIDRFAIRRPSEHAHDERNPVK